LDARSPEWFDRVYNNRALVPDFATYLQRWTADSQAVRHTQPCLTDLRYGSGPSENLDIFTTSQAKAPVLVFLHGGYWRALDKSDHSFVAPALTEQGVCVVVPNYALCPAVTIPDIVMQMVKALAWVWRHIDTWGGDPSRIHLAGHSAGGHLTAMLMGCDWRAYEPDLPPDLVKTSLSVSGLYELDSVRQSPLLQQDLRLDDKQVLACSPAWMVPPMTGQLFSVVGGLESEAFLSHNQLIQNAWGRQCVPVAQVVPGLHHFSMMDAFATRGHPLNDLVLGVCQERL
jgi:arylformamidase